MKSSRIVFSLLFPLFFTACASKGVKSDIPNAGVGPRDEKVREFEARAEVLDRKTGRINTVDVDFIAQGRTKLRMDVIGTFATPVAVVAYSNEELTCLLPRQKRFYQGPATPTALASVIGVRLDPTLFFNLLFDETPDSTNWRCRTNESGKLDSCEHLSLPQSLAWKDLQGGRRQLIITDKRFQLTMALNQVQTKVQDPVGVFSLAIPSGYTSLK